MSPSLSQSPSGRRQNPGGGGRPRKPGRRILFLAGLLVLFCLGVITSVGLWELTRKPPAAPPAASPTTPATAAPSQGLATAPASPSTSPPLAAPSPGEGITPAPALQATLRPGEVELWIHCLERCRAGTIAFLDEEDTAVLDLDFQPGKSQRASLPAGSYTYQVRFEGEAAAPLPEGQIPAGSLPAVQGSLPVDGTVARVTFWIFYPDVNILTNYK